MDQTGKIIRARREALGLSQDQLAWLADVSKTTIRNIEADRVEEARKWSQVESALGWGRGSLDVIKAGLQPNDVLSVHVLSLIIKAMKRKMEDEARVLQQAANAEEVYRRVRSALLAREATLAKAVTQEDISRFIAERDIARSSVDMQERVLVDARNKIVEERSGLERFRIAYILIIEYMSHDDRSRLADKVGWIGLFISDIRVELSLQEAHEVTRALELTLGVENLHEFIRSTLQGKTEERSQAIKPGSSPQNASPNKEDSSERVKNDLIESIESDYKKGKEGRKGAYLSINHLSALANMENIAVVSSAPLPNSSGVSMVMLLFCDPQKNPVIDKEGFRLFIEATDLVEEFLKKKHERSSE